MHISRPQPETQLQVRVSKCRCLSISVSISTTAMGVLAHTVGKAGRAVQLSLKQGSPLGQLNCSLQALLCLSLLPTGRHLAPTVMPQSISPDLHLLFQRSAAVPQALHHVCQSCTSSYRRIILLSAVTFLQSSNHLVRMCNTFSTCVISAGAFGYYCNTTFGREGRQKHECGCACAGESR